MSSGNSDYFTDAFAQDFFVDDPDRLFTLDELNSYVSASPRSSRRAREKVYTNANTNLLGKVVEVATGQDFADVLNERILEPLGQSDTRYITDVSTWTEPHALGYHFRRAAKAGRRPDPNLSIFGPAGSMISSLDDARVWGEMLATGAFLTPATQTERARGRAAGCRPALRHLRARHGRDRRMVGPQRRGPGLHRRQFPRQRDRRDDRRVLQPVGLPAEGAPCRSALPAPRRSDRERTSEPPFGPRGHRRRGAARRGIRHRRAPRMPAARDAAPRRTAFPMRRSPS